MQAFFSVRRATEIISSGIPGAFTGRWVKRVMSTPMRETAIFSGGRALGDRPQIADGRHPDRHDKKQLLSGVL